MMRFLLILFLVQALCADSKILFIGDSLTEGYGLDPEKAYPAVVKELLLNEGYKSVTIINGGVSGSTTSSGLSRLKWFQRSKPDIVVIALGANDGLRGIPVQKTEANLKKMIQELVSWDTKVVLCGMKMPPNYGMEYRNQFAEIFPTLATEFEIDLVPFLLKGVGGVPDLNLSDGIHPNEKGYRVIAKTVYSVIYKLL